MDQHTLELIVTVVVTMIGSNGLWAFIQSKSIHKSALEKMILGLGHDAIFRVADHYIRRGGITLDELDDLNKYLYKPYKEMGGNGTAETAMEKCKELPIITTAEAEKRDKEMYRKGNIET